AEFARVLERRGHVCIFWNNRDTRSAAVQLFEELIQKWNPGHVLAYRRNDWGNRFQDTGLFDRVEHRSYRQVVPMTVDDWLGMSRSISYIQSIGPEKISLFERDLRQGLASVTSIDCPYITDLWYAGKL